MTDISGPAFARASTCDANGNVIDCCKNGMSIRDWFAGMALSGMNISPDYSEGACNATLVERAYTIADRMLDERVKP